MEEKHGIKETKELVDGLLELSLCLIGVFKDGAQLQDAMELWNKIGKDEILKVKFQNAFDGYKKIPAEVKDMDAFEGVELASVLLAFVPRLLGELKSKDLEKKV